MRLCECVEGQLIEQSGLLQKDSTKDVFAQVMEWKKDPVQLGSMTRGGNKPDVECLGVALSEIPMFADGFGAQDWRIVKFW